MSNVKLKSLSLTGFRSFVEQATVEFPESGLVLVKGANTDSSGVSSGSGKSSFLLALSYGLGYCPFPATELKSWYGDNEMEVVIQTGDGATITKGSKKTSFEFRDRKVTGAAPTATDIQRYFGMDTELLSALTYRPQKTPGLFLSKTNSEMQEFLTVLLDLGRYEKAIETTQLCVKELEPVKEGLANTLSKQADDLAQLQSVLEPTLIATEKLSESVEGLQEVYNEWLLKSSLQKQIVESIKSEWASRLRIVTAEADKAALSVHVENYTEPPSEQEEALEADLVKVRDRVKVIRARNVATNQEIVRVTADMQHCSTEILREESLEEKADELKANIGAIEAQTCPTCEQFWLNDKSQMALDSANLTLADVEQALAYIPKLRLKLAELGTKKNELEASLTTQEKLDAFAQVEQNIISDLASLRLARKLNRQNWLDQQSKKATEVRSRFLEQQITVNSQFESKFDQEDAIFNDMKKKTDDAHLLYVKAQAELDKAIAENKHIERSIERVREDKKKAEQAFEATSQKYKEAFAKLSLERDLLDVLKTFLTAIFDEVLDEIAWNANQMLAQVPNVAHVTVKFKSESTTAKGTVKRSILPLVVIGGEERHMKSALSGGMSTAVELAVDLAVRKVVSARMGSTPGWLILDECFEGLGATEKESVMALLSQAAHDTLILVVDHATEFKEMFNQVIEIEYSNGRSRIKDVT